jgi:hypothetical protein
MSELSGRGRTLEHDLCEKSATSWNMVIIGSLSELGSANVDIVDALRKTEKTAWRAIAVSHQLSECGTFTLKMVDRS